MNEDIMDAVKEDVEKYRKENGDSYLEASGIANKLTHSVRPLLSLFGPLGEKDKGLHDKLLPATISSIILSLSDDFDHAMRIAKKCCDEISQAEKEIHEIQDSKIRIRDDKNE